MTVAGNSRNLSVLLARVKLIQMVHPDPKLPTPPPLTLYQLLVQHNNLFKMKILNMLVLRKDHPI